MKTDHAHVEASVFSFLAISLIAIVDYFVPLVDAHPLKIFAYMGLFVLLYGIFYFALLKMWRR